MFELLYFGLKRVFWTNFSHNIYLWYIVIHVKIEFLQSFFFQGLHISQQGGHFEDDPWLEKGLSSSFQGWDCVPEETANFAESFIFSGQILALNLSTYKQI